MGFSGLSFALPKLIYTGPVISNFYQHGVADKVQWNEFDFQIKRSYPTGLPTDYGVVNLGDGS